ncbi:MAG: hypothetical protein ABW154_00505 [Dyella sp.]
MMRSAAANAAAASMPSIHDQSFMDVFTAKAFCLQAPPAVIAHALVKAFERYDINVATLTRHGPHPPS